MNRRTFVISIFFHAIIWAVLVVHYQAEKAPLKLSIEYRKASGEKFERKSKSRTKSVSIAAGPTGSGGSSGDSLAVNGSELGIHAKYPRLSRVMGETGRVTIEVRNESGGVATVQISSGYPRLDQSALEATRDALRAGQLTAYFETRSKMQISFIFKLTPSVDVTDEL